MPSKIDRVNIEGKTFLIEPVMERTVQPGNVSRTVTTDAAATDIENVYSLLDNKKQNKRLEPPLEVCGEEEVFIEEAVKSMADCKDVPEEGSGKFFTAGGAQADKAVAFTDTSRKNFLSGMAYKAFGKNQHPRSFLGKVFGPLLGRDWKAVNLTSTIPTGGSDTRVSSAAFNGNIYVIGIAEQHGNCPLLWSRDGKTWYSCSGIPYTAYSGISVYDICYANGLFVCTVVEGSTNISGIYWSTDGISWTHSNIHGGGLKVIYAQGIWHACCYDGFYYSLDGKNWTQVSGVAALDSTSIKDICYGDGLWVIGARTTGGSSYGAWWSTDGINFTQTTTPALSSKSLDYIRYGNGLWLAAAHTGTAISNAGVWYSNDGKDWAQITNTTLQSANIVNIVFGDGRWIISTASSGCFYSLNGTDWTKFTDAKIDYGLCFANGTWVCTISNDSLIQYSNDGVNWHNASLSYNPTNSTQLRYRVVGYAGGVWFATRTMYSSDRTYLYSSSVDELDLKD